MANAPDDAMLIEMGLTEREYLAALKRIEQQTVLAAKRNEKEFVQANAKIGTSFNALATRALSMTRAVQGIPALLAATGATAAMAGVMTTVRGLAELEDAAARAGLSVQAFQELQYVADQNRIDVDAMIDGIKELQLRADEFIQTGQGGGAEAFARLGYGAADLAEKLKEPDELFLDIISRMEDLDKAAQIRVADEIFGGSGGERFVELLGQGDEGIRQMMDRANELGIVIGDDLVAQASVLDAKFGELHQRMSAYAATAAANFSADWMLPALEAALDGLDKIKAYRQALADDRELEQFAEQEREVFERLNEAIRVAFSDVPNGDLRDLLRGNVEGAEALTGALRKIQEAIAHYDEGDLPFDEMQQSIGEAVGEARTMISVMGDVDRQRFSGVIGAINAIAQAWVDARTEASLYTPPTSPGMTYGPANGVPIEMPPPVPSDLAPTTSPRPVMPTVNFGPDTSPKSSRGGGSSKTTVDEWQKEIDAIRDRTAQLQAEAVALAAVAETGFEYGDAVDYARQRAQLLYEAQKVGKDLTPELRAEIDALALGYVKAADAASTAADQLTQLEDYAAKGADAMTDLFMSIMDPARSAEDALRSLILQMIQVQMRQGMLSFAENVPGLGWLGRMISGRRAAGGIVRAGHGYDVNENGAEPFFPEVNGRILSTQQAQTALRSAAYGTGGGFSQQIVTQGGVQMDRQETVSPSGERRQILTFSQGVNAAMTEPGSAAARTLESFGMHQPRTRR